MFRVSYNSAFLKNQVNKVQKENTDCFQLLNILETKPPKVITFVIRSIQITTGSNLMIKSSA